MSFYPQQPTRINRVSWIIKQTGWRPKFWYWQTGTYMDFEDKGEGINRYCRDVSKSNVEKHFKEVFGYGSFVNPKGTGRAVIKSEANATHDGKIVELPYDLQEGEVCQRVINTKIGGYYNEERALIIKGEVKGWLIKKKPNQFNSKNCVMSFTTETDPEFDNQINKFCEGIGMDYGEIDILIDDFPFIIDANPCPGGVRPPFLSMTKKELDQFIEAHKPLFEWT